MDYFTKQGIGGTVNPGTPTSTGNIGDLGLATNPMEPFSLAKSLL
jgi:hypothetical protein